MLVGPVFTREVAVAPRRVRVYVARSVYIALLLILINTAWLVLKGTQVVRNVGDLARFGMILFQILAPLQLSLALFFSSLFAASAVAQEKDRRTLVLLLLTHLSNSELVLGKLMASLLNVLMLLAASLPVFMLTVLFGGVSFGQIARVFVVTLASVLVCGSLGSILALWREKTFQALAMTVLILVLWLASWQIVATGHLLGETWWGISTSTWAAGFSPWLAIGEASRPYLDADPALGFIGTPVNLFLITSTAIALLLNGVAISLVRVWNPSRELHPISSDDTSEETETDLQAKSLEPSVPSTTRSVWDNPVVWREIRTWAYGRKILVVRIAYLLLFTLVTGSLLWTVHSGSPATWTTCATAVVPLSLLGLVLVNAQAVTSLTTERDGRALDLLLVSDLTPREIVFGKLGGVFYNTKEMVLLPMAICVYLWAIGVLGFESMLYLLVGLMVLFGFVAMLGVHSGMHYSNSRGAIGTSLGTVFFLFLGIATCMRIMVAFSGSFQSQLPPFLAFMFGGGIGLYVALGARNPSPAILLASFACPIVTFYAITSLFLDRTGLAFLSTVVAYGFATVAMLIPAIDEFDVATGKTSAGE